MWGKQRHSPAIPLPQVPVYSREMETCVHTVTCRWMLTSALLTIMARSGNNLNGGQQNNEILSNKNKWNADTRSNTDGPWDVFSERSQSHMVPFICSVQSHKSTMAEGRLVLAQGWGGSGNGEWLLMDSGLLLGNDKCVSILDYGRLCVQLRKYTKIHWLVHFKKVVLQHIKYVSKSCLKNPHRKVIAEMWC